MGAVESPVPYDISLKIRYDYANLVVGGRHLIRLLPLTRPGVQRLVAGHIAISPPPDDRSDGLDFFGNHAVSFVIGGAHDHILLRLTARVERSAPPGGGPSLTLPELARALGAWASVDASAPVHFRAASPRVAGNPAMVDYARSLLANGQTAADLVAALGRQLHADMRFDPDATEVDTPVAEAFEKRHGVCQDFSHVMIACLRGLGIPAGYVSGFLRTSPPPGKARLEGADAMHAWVRAWCGPAAGWIDYDPTNATLVGADHIEVAFGRDYFDVAPIKGALRGAGSQRSLQSVDVVPR